MTYPSESAKSGPLSLVLVGILLAGCPAPPPPRERPRARPRARPGSLEALRAQLREGDPDRRVAAVQQLGATGLAKAVAPLTRALGDPAEPVRLAAVKALAGYRTRAADGALLAGWKGASATLRHATLVAVLTPLPPPPRLRRIARALRRLGEPALAALLRLMRISNPSNTSRVAGPDLTCKWGACRALVAMGPTRVPTLLRMAEDGIGNLREQTVYEDLLPVILGRLGPAALPPLVPLLGRPGPAGELAARLLPRADGRAVPALLTRLADPEATPQVRLAVVKVLRGIRDPKVTPALLRAARSKDSAVATAARLGLAARPTPACVALLSEVLRTAPPAEVRALVERLGRAPGPTAVKLLRRALARKEPDPVRSAVQGLIFHRDRGAVPALLKLLRRRDPKLRRAVLRALGRIGDPRARRAVWRWARRGRVLTRVAAIEALGRLGGPRAERRLARLQRSRVVAIAKAASAARRRTRVGPKGPVGLPACDEYVRRYRCYLKTLPAAARAPSAAAFDKRWQAWRRVVKSASARGSAAVRSVGRQCRIALYTFRKDFGSTPPYRHCFAPRIP